jgi:ABC-2 type transport system permease protein
VSISPRAIRTIYLKDLRDALRDARVAVALVTPLVVGLLYNVMLPPERRAEVKLAYTAGAGEIAFVEALRDGVRRSIDLKLTALPDPHGVRAAVSDRRADMGLVVPEGAVDAIKAGAAPALALVFSSGVTAGGEVVSRQLELLTRELAGQRPPATVTIDVVRRPDQQPLLFAAVGLRTAFVLSTVVMLLGMISMIVLPMLVAEESEKRTIDALLMVASNIDVVLAKGLVGLTYTVAATAILVAITRITIADATLFAAGAALLGIALSGFGLLLGGLFRSAQQVYTWSSLFLIPVFVPAFAAALPDLPPALAAAIRALPTSEAMRIFGNAAAGRALYPDVGVSIAVVAVWGIAAYALLAWRLARREA